MTSRLSKLFQTSAAAETIFLVVLGVLAVTLHAYLRLPIKVPGHNGLVWIGLLMVGRLVSRRRWAATISSTSAAATSLLPVMGFKDPLDAVTFLIPGIVLDLGFMLSPRFVVSLWAIALLGAIAHATKPVAKLLVSVGSGFPFPSLVAGVAYPLSLHALFGAAGAILALISLKLGRRRG
ncbi:MAG: hypothetical protein ACE5M4_04610 [Anaerolineales bacterium]